ncbi:MAG TPA: glycosyltransferase family 2 protein [Dongiaceae bacterium]|nr:glycosyltransferase family 2 protein [Dongiaceae bacterium]
MEATESPAPKVSVVMPCRNEAAWIEKCLAAVLAAEPPAGGLEIIVADGQSDDGTRKILEGLAQRDFRIRMIDNPGRIVPTGLNAAIRAARGEIIIRLDAHTEYAPDYLRQCTELIQTGTADNVGGPWVAEGQGWLSEAIAAAFQSPFAVGGARGHDPDYEGPVDTVYLGCWKRAAFDRFGYFDEELVRNQDDEYNLRLIRAGGKIWQSPKIKSRYHPRGSLSGLFRQYMQYGYWKVRVIQKHRLPASIRHLVPGLFLVYLLLTGVAGFFWPLLWVAFGLALGAYGFAVLLASGLTAARTRWKLLPALPLVFPCYHFGYGYGFLRGLVNFMILKRRAQAGFQQLTR